MRTNLASYSGRYIKVVATVSKFGTVHKEGPNSRVLVHDVTLAETGESLTQHLWIKNSAIIKKQNITPGDKIFFIAKVAPYQKGYAGNLFKKILKTNDISYDYHLIDIKIALKQKDFINNKKHLEKLNYRKQYISKIKEKNIIDQLQAEDLIKKTEAQKHTLKNNPLLIIRPIHTIESNFQNRFHKFPFIYATVETIKNKKDLLQTFKTNYQNIKDYHKKQETIKQINLNIIQGYKILRITNKRLENIQYLEPLIENKIEQLENTLAPAKNVIWNSKPQEQLTIEEPVKQKQIIKR